MRSKRFISFPDGANVKGFSSVDNTAVYKIPADWDIVAALSDRAVIEGNKYETQIGICKAESKYPSYRRIGLSKSLRDLQSVLWWAWFWQDIRH